MVIFVKEISREQKQSISRVRSNCKKLKLNYFKKFHVEGKEKNRVVVRKSSSMGQSSEADEHGCLCMFMGRGAAEGRDG